MRSAGEIFLSGLRGAKHFSNAFRIVFRILFQTVLQTVFVSIYKFFGVGFVLQTCRPNNVVRSRPPSHDQTMQCNGGVRGLQGEGPIPFLGNARLFTKVLFTIFAPLKPPPPNHQNDGFPLEFLLKGPQTELRTLSQNCEQTLQKLRTNRIMNKRAFLNSFRKIMTFLTFFRAPEKKGFSFFSRGATPSRTVPKTQPLQVAFSVRERLDLRSQNVWGRVGRTGQKKEEGCTKKKGEIFNSKPSNHVTAIAENS